MVWLIEQGEELHPILAIALGESDEVVVRVPVAAGSRADGATLGELQLDIEPGFHVLAVRRGGRYFYRPRGHVRLRAGDELIASGPDEGHARPRRAVRLAPRRGRRDRRARARPPRPAGAPPDELGVDIGAMTPTITPS